MKLAVPGTDWELIPLDGRWFAMDLRAKRLGPFDDWRDALRATQKERVMEATQTAPRMTRKVQAALKAEADSKAASAHLHKPGDGWHYVPGKSETLWNGRNWYIHQPTSEGAICANVRDLLASRGQTFEEVYCRAYPQERLAPVITAEDQAQRERAVDPANADDWRRTLADLQDVNFNSLCGLLFQMAEGILPAGDQWWNVDKEVSAAYKECPVTKPNQRRMDNLRA